MGAAAIQMKCGDYLESLKRGKHCNQGRKKPKKKKKVKHWRNN